MYYKLTIGLITSLVAFLLLWPTDIDPVAWTAPEAPTPSSDNRLSGVELLQFPNAGPEDLALAPNGTLYTSSLDGTIYEISEAKLTPILNTGGRPLGLEWSAYYQSLVIADAINGLGIVSSNSSVNWVSTHVADTPILYADDLDVTSNGMIYFSDASTKFSARAHGIYGASLLDIMEHGANGRLLKYDPTSDTTEVVLDNLHFANGVAISFDELSVLVIETSKYRVLRHWLAGPKNGETEVFIENLPGFPDNINRNIDGNYWIGLVSPRNALLDALSQWPFIRNVIQRLPSWMRPKAERLGQIIVVNEAGELVNHYADQTGRFGFVTGGYLTEEWLYLSSLHEESLARLKINEQ